MNFSHFAACLPVWSSGSCGDLSPCQWPVLPDLPRFHVSSHSILPSSITTWSSSRVLPLHLNFCNCSGVFSFLPPLLVPEPFQPDPSHDCPYRLQLHPCFLQDLLISQIFQHAHIASLPLLMAPSWSLLLPSLLIICRHWPCLAALACHLCGIWHRIPLSTATC